MRNPEAARQNKLIVIGNDQALLYLMNRYTEQSSYQLVQFNACPMYEELEPAHPAAIIFSSIEQLQSAQALVDRLSLAEIPVFVCAALADEAHARELGADACLLHPLTYENFSRVLISH